MKKISKLLVVAILAALVLTGCGSKGNEGGGDKKEITLWTMPFAGDTTKLEALWEDLATEFEKDTGVKVIWEVIPWGNRGTKILTALASGQGPDVFYVIPSEAPKYIDDGLIQDLTSYLDSKDLEDFMGSALEPTKAGDKQYGLPILTESYSQLYNKAILDELNVTELPKTWEEFDALAEKAKAAGYYATNYQAAGSLNSTLFQYIWQAGGDILTPEGEIKISEPEALKAFQYIDKLSKEGFIPKNVMDTDSLRTQWNSGKVLSIKGGVPEIGEIDGFEVVIGEPLSAGKQATFGSSGSFVLSQVSKHPKEAADFIKLLTSEETQKEFNTLTGYIPSRVSAQTILDNDPIGKKLAEFAPMGITGVRHPLSADITAPIQAAVQAMLEGTSTPEKAAEDSAAAIKALLEK